MLINSKRQLSDNSYWIFAIHSHCVWYHNLHSNGIHPQYLIFTNLYKPVEKCILNIINA